MYHLKEITIFLPLFIIVRNVLGVYEHQVYEVFNPYRVLYFKNTFLLWIDSIKFIIYYYWLCQYAAFALFMNVAERGSHCTVCTWIIFY